MIQNKTVGMRSFAGGIEQKAFGFRLHETQGIINMQAGFSLPSIGRATSQKQLMRDQYKIAAQSINRLAQPKHKAIEESDLDNDKIGLKDMLKDTRNEISHYIRDVFDTKDPDTINGYVKSAESLKLVKDEIDHMNMTLNENKKILNENRFQVEKKEAKIKGMNEVLKDLHKKVEEAPVTIMRRLEEKNESEDIRVQMEEMQTETLSHIIERDKLSLRLLKKPIDETQKNINLMEGSTQSVGKVLTRNDENAIVHKMDKNQIKKVCEKRNKRMNLQVQAYLQDVEQRAIFQEVYKNQNKIKEDEEKECQKKKHEEVKQRKIELSKERELEEKRKASAIKEISKYYDTLLKFQENCNLKEINDLQDYNEDLNNVKDNFQKTIVELDKMKVEKKKQLEADREELEIIRYHHSQGDDDDGLKKFLSEKEKEEKEIKIKKLQSIIAQALTSIHRVAFQLKEDAKNIGRHNMLDKLSICGLRLEHMIATLAKKNQTFPIESINTDYSLKHPPKFIGIDAGIYINPADHEQEEEDNAFQRLYNMKNKKSKLKLQQLEMLDDQEVYFQDEYEKRKEEEMIKQGIQPEKRKKSMGLRALPMSMSSNDLLAKGSRSGYATTKAGINRVMDKTNPAMKQVCQLVHRTRRVFMPNQQKNL